MCIAAGITDVQLAGLDGLGQSRLGRHVECGGLAQEGEGTFGAARLGQLILSFPAMRLYN